MNSRKQYSSLARNLPLVALTTILAATAAVSGCRSSDIVPIAINNPNGGDPSDANLAPAHAQPFAQTPQSAPRNVRVLASQQSYTPKQTPEQYPQQQYPQQQYPQQAPAPIERQDPSQTYDNSLNSYDSGELDGYEALADASQPPPPLPEYDQPPVPEPNDLWTPGYWNYASQGYYWVPGVWVAPPYIGALWTPAYWGYDGGRYRLHRGFWARHVGFYGGINYGFGYTGSGYRGGYWNGNDFFYNRSVNRVNITNIHNVYERNVTVNNVTRVSYNGGNGGINARPGPQELAVLREQRTPPMATQVQLREASSQNRQQFYNENHGRPAQTFATRPIAAERGNQPLPTQTFQQQNERPQPATSTFNQQRIGQQPTQQQQRVDPQHQTIQNQPQGRFQPQPQQPGQTQTQQQQRIDPQHQTIQNQPQGRFQNQPQQQPAQTTNQQQQRFEPHNNHQIPPNPQHQQDAVQQSQRYQQQQQAAQEQRLQQQSQQQADQQRAQQRVVQQQAEQQRIPQQRSIQPQQSVQPRPEFQQRPQQAPAPQPQSRPQPQPQTQQQPRQEAPRAEQHNGGRPNRQ